MREEKKWARCLSASRRRQIGYQPKRDSQLIQLEVRLEKSNGPKGARIPRNFHHFNTRLAQRF
jgi:hypothetical protein